MRNKIFVILLLVIAVIVGGLSVNSYQDYKVERQNEAQKIATEREATAAVETKQRERQQAEIELLKTECEKGLANYNALPTKDQLKYAKPICSLEEVE